MNFKCDNRKALFLGWLSILMFLISLVFSVFPSKFLTGTNGGPINCYIDNGVTLETMPITIFLFIFVIVGLMSGLASYYIERKNIYSILGILSNFGILALLLSAIVLGS